MIEMKKKTQKHISKALGLSICSKIYKYCARIYIYQIRQVLFFSNIAVHIDYLEGVKEDWEKLQILVVIIDK